MANKIMYHATPYENLISILDNGIRTGIDNVVYLTEKPEDAVKFLAVRLVEKILVCEVLVEESELLESYDHNERFFGCKVYMVNHSISSDDITDYLLYER